MTLSTIHGVLRQILLDNSGVRALVSERVYPLSFPDNCIFPALSLSRVSDPYSRVSGSPRFQVDIWAKDFLGAQVLAQKVEEALDGYSGIVEGWEILKIIPLDCQDTEEEKTGLFHIPYDFKIIFRK